MGVGSPWRSLAIVKEFLALDLDLFAVKCVIVVKLTFRFTAPAVHQLPKFFCIHLPTLISTSISVYYTYFILIYFDFIYIYTLNFDG